MWWTDALRAIPIAFTVFAGSADQTPSLHLRPVSDVYRQAERTLEGSSKVVGSYRPPAPVRLDELDVPLTRDTGAMLKLHRYLIKEATGRRLVLYWLPEDDVPATGGMGPQPTVDLALPAHARAVRWITDTAGLSADQLRALIGVSRQSVQTWKTGGTIRPANLRSLMEIRDVLERAMRQRPGQQELAAWLATPDRHTGVAPADLLKRGEFDRARLLAILSPSAVDPLPARASEPVPPQWRMSLESPDEAYSSDDDLPGLSI